MINITDFNGKVKYVSFTKTFLLIIISEVVTNDWNTINK